MKRKYKFENYKDKDFPVYSSKQTGRVNLALPHFHEDVELIFINSGKVELVANTTVLNIHQGSLVIIPPSVTHSIKSLTYDAEITGLVFNIKVLNLPVTFSLNTDCFVLENSSPFYENTKSEFDCAVNLYENPSLSYKLKMRSRLLMILAHLTDAEFILPESEDTLQRRLTPALNYISENFSQPIKIHELSSLICVCDDHFIRLFKSATGKTPSEYIMDLRISNAVRLLSSDKLSVSEIAQETGFLNSAYFTKIFKQKLSMTPTEYRKNIHTGK